METKRKINKGINTGEEEISYLFLDDIIVLENPK